MNSSVKQVFRRVSIATVFVSMAALLLAVLFWPAGEKTAALMGIIYGAVLGEFGFYLICMMACSLDVLAGAEPAAQTETGDPEPESCTDETMKDQDPGSCPSVSALSVKNSGSIPDSDVHPDRDAGAKSDSSASYRIKEPHRKDEKDSLLQSCPNHAQRSSADCACQDRKVPAAEVEPVRSEPKKNGGLSSAGFDEPQPCISDDAAGSSRGSDQNNRSLSPDLSDEDSDSGEDSPFDSEIRQAKKAGALHYAGRYVIYALALFAGAWIGLPPLAMLVGILCSKLALAAAAAAGRKDTR